MSLMLTLHELLPGNKKSWRGNENTLERDVSIRVRKYQTSQTAPGNEGGTPNQIKAIRQMNLGVSIFGLKWNLTFFAAFSVVSNTILTRGTEQEREVFSI